jgi:hypothetical protein
VHHAQRAAELAFWKYAQPDSNIESYQSSEKRGTFS